LVFGFIKAGPLLFSTVVVVIAYSDGQRIGRIVGHNGTMNADFVRFESRDRTNACIALN